MTWHNIKQWGLISLLLLYGSVLETKAAIGAFHAQIDPASGVQHAALSATCALAAFVFANIAGGTKNDVRPFVRGSATLCRIISLCFLVVPISYLGSALKQDRLAAEWAAYTASPAYQADIATASDVMADRYERQAAQSRIVEPVQGELSILDGEWWIAAFFQLVLIAAASIKLVPPATAEDVRHWRAVEAGRKAAITRKRNAQKRKQRRPFLRIVGGKS